MNADRLLAHYEQTADAPDAIARLRRFILELAVRGKLVPQDAADESAIEFDRAIASRLATPFDIPEQWKWARLERLGTLKGGGTPSKSRDDYWNGNIPWVSPKDMKVDYLAKAQLNITEVAIAGSAANLIKPGSVLFVVRGMILAHSFPAAITRVPLAINQDMKALVLKKPEMAEFILRALKGLKPEMLKRVRRSSHGTCRIEGADYSDFLIPIPPLGEQHRIVAKVDELMVLCDRLEAARGTREAVRDRLAAASLARLNAPDPETFFDDVHFALGVLPAVTSRPDQIKQLRQTILNLAVRGKLVPQDRNDEPASELLKRIAKEKARLAKENELKKVEKVEDLTRSDHGLPIPDGWTITNLQSICNSVTDGDHLPPPRAEAGIPFLVIGNVRSQRIEFAESRFVPAQYYEALDPIRRPRRGDLLYTLVGSYGIPVLVRDDRRFCVQRHIGILRPSALIDVNFLARAMETSAALDQATACATGIAQKTVPLSGLRRLVLPLPPFAEQRRIVAKVDELMGLCDRLEASLTAAAATRRRLLDALLAEALAPADTREMEAAE